MVGNGDGSGAAVSLINNPTKVQTWMAASGTEEESALHQVALVKNLLTYVYAIEFCTDNVHKTEIYGKCHDHMRSQLSVT